MSQSDADGSAVGRTSERPDPQHERSAARPSASIAAVVAVLAAIEIPHGYAIVSLGTIASLFAIPSVFRRRNDARLFGVAALGVLASIALATAARYNGVKPDKQAALAFLCLAGVLVAAHVLARGKIGRAISIVCGVEIGTILFNVFGGYSNTQGSFTDLWKYGIAAAATALALVVFNYVREILWPTVALLAALSVVTLFLNFRSHSIICVVTIWLLLAKHDRVTRKKISGRTWAIGLCAIVAITYLPGAIVGGVFGQTVQLKTQQQLESGGPLLLAGRTEPPLSITAIAQRPLSGWGNADNISNDTIDKASVLAGHLGMHDYKTYLPLWIRADGSISLHSVALSAWVEGGIFAAICPLVLIYIFIRLCLGYTGRWVAVVTFLAVQASWDALFSPWTYGQSTISAVIVSIWLLSTAKRRPAPPRPAPCDYAP